MFKSDLSNTFPIVLIGEISHKLDVEVSYPTLKLGHTFKFVCFQSVGNSAFRKELFNRKQRGTDVSVAISLRTRLLIASGPVDFPKGICFNIYMHNLVR